MSSSEEEKFWSRVLKTETCWLWTGAKTKDGYGHFTLPNTKKPIYVHRYVYTLTRGAIPATYFVCHACDVRNCVRPDHLFVGTNKDNVDDREKKGRHHDMRGELHQNSKFTETIVRQIRERAASGESMKALAEEFNVGYTAVQKVVARTRWAHIL